MKTVMKRLFSLMLVAVLLVSAVPTAFAAEATIPCPRCNETATLVKENAVSATCTTVQRDIYHCPNEDCEYNKDFYNDIAGSEKGHDFKNGVCQRCGNSCSHQWDGGAVTKAPTCTEKGELSYTCTICGHVHKDSSHASVQPTGHTAGAGSCTEGKTCVSCGILLIAAPGHTPGPAASCTTAQTCTTCGAELEAAKGHDYGTDGNCKRGCGSSETGTHEVYFSVNGDQNFWHLGVKHNHTVKVPGFTYGTDYTFLKQVGDTATHKFLGWSKNPSDTTGSALEYIIEMPVKESVVYYAIYQAKETSSGSGSSGSSGSGSSGSGSSGSTSTPNYPTGSHTLRVWANVYIGTTLEKEILLTSIEGVGGNAAVVDVIAAHRNDIHAEINSSRFADYHGAHWETNVYYYKVKNGEYKAVDNKMIVGEDNNVYINVYSGEKLVVVNVHTRKSYSTDLTVRIRGKRVGDVVTYENIKDAVKKQYNVSDLSVYEYDEWCKVVEGKTGSKTYSFKVAEGDNVYEAYVSGSRKTTSSSSKADSSNPKTGDMIFAPVAVMGLSVSALAVLFYLNKKRAY